MWLALLSSSVVTHGVKRKYLVFVFLIQRGWVNDQHLRTVNCTSLHLACFLWTDWSMDGWVGGWMGGLFIWNTATVQSTTAEKVSMWNNRFKHVPCASHNHRQPNYNILLWSVAVTDFFRITWALHLRTCTESLLPQTVLKSYTLECHQDLIFWIEGSVVQSHKQNCSKMIG